VRPRRSRSNTATSSLLQTSVPLPFVVSFGAEPLIVLAAVDCSGASNASSGLPSATPCSIPSSQVSFSVAPTLSHCPAMSTTLGSSTIEPSYVSRYSQSSSVLLPTSATHSSTSKGLTCSVKIPPSVWANTLAN